MKHELHYLAKNLLLGIDNLDDQHTLTDDSKIYCCSCFYDKYVIWINENKDFMVFNPKKHCFKVLFVVIKYFKRI